MSDHDDTHDVDVCPECHAVESFEDGRCQWCKHGICRSCLSEPVLIDPDGRCQECGGREVCSICGASISMESKYPLCKPCEGTARRAGGKPTNHERRVTT